MAYITTINQQTYTVETKIDNQPGSILFDGVNQEVDWRRIAPLASAKQGANVAGGHYSLIIAGQSYDVFAYPLTKAGEKGSQTYEIQLAGQRFEVKVEDERTSKLAELARTDAFAGEITMQAPMPGLVVGVAVEPGATVTEGQAVVVLEAMKMENDLTSPIAGTIREVRVNKGQAVDQGQVLVVITSL